MRKAIKQLLANTENKVDRLRVVVSRMSYSQKIDALPDLFSEVLELYDHAVIHEDYRTNIHTILSNSVELSKAVLDPTFDTVKATTLVTEQMKLLTGFLDYMTQRPARMGWSILNPKTGALIGQFASAAEAQLNLDAFTANGLLPSAIPVPVRITSEFALRPSATVPEPLSGPIPDYLKPSPDLMDLEKELWGVNEPALSPIPPEPLAPIPPALEPASEPVPSPDKRPAEPPSEPDKGTSSPLPAGTPSTVSAPDGSPR